MQALIAGTVPESFTAPAASPEPEPAAAGAAAATTSRPFFGLPTPRAAAVAVTGVLACGVLIGSIVSPAAESSAQSPIIVAVSPPAAAPAPAPAPAEAAPAEDVTDTAPVEQAAPPQQQTIYQTVPQQSAPTAPTPPPALPIPPPPALPTISHVFVVMLTGHGYEAAFGQNSPATYLSKTLTTHGELIPNYYGIAHGELANEIALISGQGPTKQTASNCPNYGDVTPGMQGDQGQATGDGCVYPTDVKTLADQLFTTGNTWKAYVEGAGTAGCDHTTTNYTPWRNPFIYFHSLVDNPALCNANVADLSQLQTDLQQVGETPGLSYIVPNNCHNGSDTPCAPDQPAGLAAADAWLQTAIPMIEDSPGYKQGGMIAITFDSAPKDGPEADSTACCGQPETYPNLPADDPSQQPSSPPPSGDAPAPSQDAPAASASQFGGGGGTNTGTTTTPTNTGTTTTPTNTNGTPTPPPTRPSGGGGKVGLLLISPYIKPNTVNQTGYYNHFSLFASIEDLFNAGHIGYANLADLTVFDKSVYTNYNPSSASTPAP
jgi:phosphatidylinositol-3-phosphatase